MPHIRLPPLYTYEQLREIAQTNGVVEWATMEIRALATLLWDQQYITQAMLDARQDELLAIAMAEHEE
ncbi:MAG: hypothetical protein WD512_14635 [Candidatus Paceibacterota bacterium]